MHASGRCSRSPVQYAHREYRLLPNFREGFRVRLASAIMSGPRGRRFDPQRRGQTLHSLRHQPRQNAMERAADYAGAPLDSQNEPALPRQRINRIPDQAAVMLLGGPSLGLARGCILPIAEIVISIII